MVCVISSAVLGDRKIKLSQQLFPFPIETIPLVIVRISSLGILRKVTGPNFKITTCSVNTTASRQYNTIVPKEPIKIKPISVDTADEPFQN